MLLVDSSVWIDYFNGKETPNTLYLRDKADRNKILVGDLIICEVLQGFRHDRDFEAARNLLLSFAYHDITGRKVALLAAENYRTLRRKGVTVRKTIDILIASFCIQNNHELLHNDKDFDVIEKYLSLRVFHP
ncbi:PIN domain nuclease [Candidatus Halobeggiatoa sp. HSG11]|nr:PIN domain nuclease [Candidatus Halobeggiatoa sp. HSG11]